MEQTYQIDGMTCGGCVARVQKALDASARIDSAHIQLEHPQATITFAAGVETMDISELQALVHQGGHYAISPIGQPHKASATTEEQSSGWAYKPLAIIVGFITGVTFLAQWPFAEGWDAMLWMRHFMAGFFLVFSGFKLLNLRGFAESYRMYDLVAARWKAWGLVYPFVELGLGVMYLMDLAPFVANLTTAIVLGVSSIGVIRSVLNRTEIRCACLGDVFNLPMSTVTIVEDLTMGGMAGIMLILGA